MIIAQKALLIMLNNRAKEREGVYVCVLAVNHNLAGKVEGASVSECFIM